MEANEIERLVCRVLSLPYTKDLKADDTERLCHRLGTFRIGDVPAAVDTVVEMFHSAYGQTFSPTGNTRTPAFGRRPWSTSSRT